jgi:hypothetical protein
MGTFLRWTGNQVATATGFAAMMMGNLMVLAVEPFEWIDPQRGVGVWVLLGGFAIAIPAFVGLCLFARCPRCRARVIWHAVSKREHPRGVNGLLLSPECPFCGFTAVTDGSLGRRSTDSVEQPGREP